MALSHLRQKEEALNVFTMLNPISHTMNKEDCQIYQVEPYVIPADIYTHKIFYAKGGWTWYTGSSAWFYKVGIEELLGFRKYGKTLHFDIDKIPFQSYHLTYHYKDTTYEITFQQSKTTKITLDQQEIKNDIPLSNDKKTHSIEIKGGKI